MKLLDDEKYLALIEALHERAKHYEGFKEKELYNLKDCAVVDVLGKAGNIDAFPFIDEWSVSLKSFNFDPVTQGTIENLKDQGLIKAHRHVYGNNFWQDGFGVLGYLSEDSTDNSKWAVLYRNKFRFEDKAKEFVSDILFRDQLDNEPVQRENQLSSYERAYIAPFFFDVLGNVLKSDKIEDKDNCAHYADKMKEIAQSEVKIANALYDFAESLADKLSIPVQGKVKKHSPNIVG